MKKKLRLRPYVFPAVYMILVLVLLGTVYYNGLINNSYEENDSDNDLKYVTTLDLLDSIEVAAKDAVMVKPYTSDDVKIGKNYYDYKDSSEKQEDSIIYYEGTYIQNSGVDYTSEKEFEVFSCLDGTVISAEKTDLMGYVVEIRYNNDIVMSYQSLSEISVKKDDTVSKGQKIGTSGKSTIGSELGNHLHLEMYHNGTTVNPEKYYNKNIKDI